MAGKVFKWLLPLFLGRLVSAEYFNNESMTEPMRKVWAGDIWGAWQAPFIKALGDWFYGGLVFSPVASWWLFQRSMHIPAIWLIAVLIAYQTKFVSLPPYVFYLFVVSWVANGLLKLFWVKYSS